MGQSQAVEAPGCLLSLLSREMSNFPEIKSKHSLVAKHVTAPLWEKLSSVVTATSGFTLAQAIACAVEFDNQHCGIYAGDWDSYKDFAEVFDPLIQEYHGISPDAVHTSDMDVNKIQGNINSAAPVHSCRIRVGRSIDGFGLSPRSRATSTQQLPCIPAGLGSDVALMDSVYLQDPGQHQLSSSRAFLQD